MDVETTVATPVPRTSTFSRRMWRRANAKRNRKIFSFFPSTAPAILKQHAFLSAFKTALACSCLAGVLKYFDRHGPEHFRDFLIDMGGASSYKVLGQMIGLLIVFQLSHAYKRYWEGCDATFAMMSDLYDIVSQSISFCKTSGADVSSVRDFEHLIIRLASLWQALLFADLEGAGDITGSEVALKYELLDAGGLDDDSIRYLRESKGKTRLVCQWLQSVLVEAQNKGVIKVPAPICARLFAELNGCMGSYHKALKIAESPFPYPYYVISEICLWVYWLLTAFLVGNYTKDVWLASSLAFLTIFIICSLRGVCLELENPFKQFNDEDMSYINFSAFQRDFNQRLLMLLEPAAQHIPKISPNAEVDFRSLRSKYFRKSYTDIFGEETLPNAPRDASATQDACNDVFNCPASKKMNAVSTFSRKDADALVFDDERAKVIDPDPYGKISDVPADVISMEEFPPSGTIPATLSLPLPTKPLQFSRSHSMTDEITHGQLSSRKKYDTEGHDIQYQARQDIG